MNTKKIDQYFLTESCPFTGKRKINMKVVKIIGGSLLGLGLISILFFGENPTSMSDGTAINSISVDQAKSQTENSNMEGSIQVGSSGFVSNYIRSSAYSGTGMSRQYTASQVIKPSGGINDQLPIGTTISLKLLNRIVSSDNNSPVIGVVLEDVNWKDNLVIPQGTKAIGRASFDDASKRLQIRFSTLVFPEGEQHPVNGVGLLADGSSGLPGDYHSGEAQKQIGRFMGNFIGGLAEGMKNKEGSTQSGMSFEPGSLKNGLLNGVKESAFDQAKSYTERMEKVKPYLEVPAGVSFLLYLEKEF